MRKFILFSIPAALQLAFPLYEARAAEKVAAIIDYHMQYTMVTRAKEPVTMTIGSPLNKGDLVMLSKEGFLKLHTGDGCKILTISKEELRTSDDGGTCEVLEVVSPYKIEFEASDSFFGAGGRRLRQIADWWDPRQRRRQSLYSRDSEAPEIPALGKATGSTVLAGDRTLRIRWLGGQPPFRVRITGPDGAVFDGRPASDERVLMIPAVITAGTDYGVELSTDNPPRKAHYTFHGATDFGGDVTDAGDDYARADRLMKLVSKTRGAWALEAVQQLSTYNIDLRLKGALIDAIEHGDWP